MNITADDLETWDYSDLDHVHYLIGCEKDRRRIQSYPDEFTKILREGLDGYDEAPLHALIDEYSKISGDYNHYRHIADVVERYDYSGKHILHVETKDYDGDYSSYDVPLHLLKDLDAAKEAVRLRDEAAEKAVIAGMEMQIRTLKERINERKGK